MYKKLGVIMIKIAKKLMVTICTVLSMQAYAISPDLSNTSTVEENLTKAVVKKIDRENGKITLKHEDIKNLDMPGMTMVFKAKDVSSLENLKEGDSVDAQLDKENGSFIVKKIIKK